MYEVFKDRLGCWRFRLKANNGKVILQSEAYKRKSSALKGIVSIQAHAFTAIEFV